MNYISKAVAVASLSFISVNAFAAENAMDSVRDNLKDLYDDLGGAGTWVGSDYTEARDAIQAFALYSDELTRTQVSFDFINGISVDYTTAFDQSTLDGKVDDITDGVMTDIFGKTSITETDSDNNVVTDIVSTDSNGEMTSGLSDSALLDDKLETELGKLNTAMSSGDLTTIDNAITAFGTSFTNFNTGITGYFGTNGDQTSLEGLDSREDVFSYGVAWHASKNQYVSGSGDDVECYASYEDYAKGTTTTCN